jgi:regulator of CtrA degradation
MNVWKKSVMGRQLNDRGGTECERVTVSFGQRLVASEVFNRLFQDGMALVERTAAYLDGEGRKEARRLRPPILVIYATESMRLTTRLLELSSWLVIARAVRDGRITPEEGRRKRERVKLTSVGRPSHISHYAELPAGLRQLIEASFAMNDRIVQLDRALAGTATEHAAAAVNSVAAQIARLQAAFGTARAGAISK